MCAADVKITRNSNCLPTIICAPQNGNNYRFTQAISIHTFKNMRLVKHNSFVHALIQLVNDSFFNGRVIPQCERLLKSFPPPKLSSCVPSKVRLDINPVIIL